MNAAMLTVGTYTVIPLVDVEGAFFPIEVVFPNVPLTAWERYRTRYADTFAASSLLYTRVTCYLLRGHGRTILVDAGVGPGPAPLFGHARGALLERLRDQGLRPEDIDTVVLTHLHPDHIGWAAVDGQPTFPRARYVISRTDVDTFHREDVRSAMHAIVPGYLDACLSPLEAAGVVDLVGDRAEIAPGVVVRLASGHTPGMLRVEIGEGSSALWLVADTFTHPAQVARPDWCSAFDLRPEQAIETRRTTIEDALVAGVRVMASHFPPFPGSLQRDDSELAWIPSTS